MLRKEPRARIEDGAGDGSGGQHADEAVLGEQRHRQHGLVLQLLEVRAHVRGDLDPRIGERVRGRHGAPIADGEADRPRPHRPDRAPARARLGLLRDGQREEIRAVGVDAIHHRGATAQQRPQALRAALTDHVRLVPLGEQPADAGQRARLLLACTLVLE